MNDLLDLRAGHWNLVILPSQRHKNLLFALAQLAEHSPLIVLDCGRQFDSSIVARAARGRAEIIDRIKIQRAFICSEVATLLQQTPSGRIPVLILDLLITFYDENVKIQTRKFLLESSLQHLQRLSHNTGVAVTTHFPPASPDSSYLFQRLRSCASRVLTHETTPSDTKQLKLF